MNILILGGGGREHALRNALVKEGNRVTVTPGNSGIPNSIPTGVAAQGFDLYLFGPELPLVNGAADRLRDRGCLVVGPGAAGAKLEGSKAFMKTALTEAGIPTADFRVVRDSESAKQAIDELFRDTGVAIKTDWLAGGKGVTVTTDRAGALADAQAKLDSQPNGLLVIEELLEGREVSVMFLCDGTRAVALPAARDYKPLLDNDQGPNTGGMGAFCPLPDSGWLDAAQDMADRMLHWFKSHGIDYRGILYAGLMLTNDGPKLLEWNVRLGDPESQVILPCIANLTELFTQTAAGNLLDQPEFLPSAHVVVALAIAGYPRDNTKTGDRIYGITEAMALEGVTVLHGATSSDMRRNVYTAGGRTLYVVGSGHDVRDARKRTYDGVRKIGFAGMQYRTDIAANIS